MRIVRSAWRYAVTLRSLRPSPFPLSNCSPPRTLRRRPPSPRLRTASISARSTRPPTLALTSINTPGNWRKANPIPADQSRWGRFNELSERNRYLLYVDLKKAADSAKTPLQRKYGDFFAACMDTGLADKLGDKPIEPLFARIDAIKDKKDVAAVAAYLDSKTPTGIFFRFGVEQDQKDSTKQIEGIHQGGLTLPDRDYYLQDDPHMQAIRAEIPRLHRGGDETHGRIRGSGRGRRRSRP